MALSAPSIPLPAPRPLLAGETPYRAADVAPGLAETAAVALSDLRADLQLLAGCSLSADQRALAEQMHGTAAQLQALAERFRAEAAAAA